MKNTLIFLVFLCLTGTLLTACGDNNDNSINSREPSDNINNNAPVIPSNEHGGEIISPPLYENNEIIEAEDGLPHIEKASYTLLTSGNLPGDDRDTASNRLFFEAGEIIEAYPLDLAAIFENSYAYSDKYLKEVVSFSGYVHGFGPGEFTLAMTPNEDVGNSSTYNRVVIFRSRTNINEENGWGLSDGDYITVVAYSRGRFSPDGGVYFVMDYPFLVEN